MNRLLNYNPLNHHLLNYRRWIVVFFAALLIGLSLGTPKFGIDASSDAILLENDDSLKYFQKMIKRYTSGDIFIVAYVANDGNSLSPKSIDNIDQLTKRLALIDGVDSALSITNSPLLFSPKGDIQQLLANPRTLLTDGIDIELARKEFNSNPLYSETLISDDARATVILLNLKIDEDYLQIIAERDEFIALEKQKTLSAQQQQRYKHIQRQISRLNESRQIASRNLIAEINAIADDYRNDANIVLGGATMITVNMIDFIKQDMAVFGVLILLIVIVALWILFKQWQIVFLALLSCLSVNVMMVGLLGWLDWKVTLISSNFMIFLFIISLATCIHLLIRFREDFQPSNGLDMNEALDQMVSRMWRPCLYNMLTTVVAFASLITSGIRPVMDFGWIMAIGVCMALMVCFIVIPVGLSFFPNLERKSLSIRQGRWLTYLALWVQRNGLLIIGSAVVVFVIAVVGALKIDVENRFIDFFKENTQVSKTMTLIDKEFGGTMPFDIILDAPTVKVSSTPNNAEDDIDDDLFNDDLFNDDLFVDEEDVSYTSYWWSVTGLQQIEQLHDFLDEQPEIGKIYSLATGYKLAKTALDINIGDVELSVLRQQLGDLEEQVLTPYLYEAEDQTRISMRIHETAEGLNRQALMQRIQQYAHVDMQLQPEQLKFTGLMVLYNNMLQSLFASQIITLGTVFLAITSMAALLFRSLRLALIAIAPNAIAALLVLGVMGHFGISLDFMTITIAAITIGIGIDYAIHYIYRFRQEVDPEQGCGQAILPTNQSIGRSLVFSTLTIVCGFSVLLFSNFIPSVLFALLTSLAMLSALFGVLTLVPRLLMMVCPTKIEAHD